MATKRLILLFTILVSMVGTKVLAYDIAVENADGVTIFYQYINDGTELEVTNGGYNRYKGFVVIPEEVTYMNRTLKVTSIGGEAFIYSGGLISITIPNSVTSIGNDAFQSCSSLTSITIPNSVTSIGNGAFYDCSSLTSITIPNSVTSIGGNTFCGCSSLTSITIPNSVTSIGNGAFSYCGLTSLTIPNSVMFIGDEAFYDCNSLTSITIPNSVTSIGGNAFSYCNGLTSITIPNSVTSIGMDAFHGTEWYDNQPNGLIYVGRVAYKYKGKMPNKKSITIKDGTVGITGRAFSDCYGLTSITIPNGVTSLEYEVFDGCYGLTSITIPNSVTSIGEGAFSGCSSLTSIKIPNSVTSIGDRAFYDCSSLTSVTIPNSVTSIGDNAFYNCNGLTTITSGIENPFAIDDGVFPTRVYNNASLFIPSGKKSAYQNTAGWKRFQNIYDIEDVTRINNISDNRIKNNAIYNLNGQRLQKGKKGINIINGKKVIIR